MTLELFEPLCDALKETLEQLLPAQIATVNATVTDGVTLDPIAQYLDYMPFAGALEGGTPCIGIQWVDTQFQDELQSSATAEHTYAVIAALSNADHQTLARQLRRIPTAILGALQIDRTRAASESIMRTKGGAWSVGYKGVQPGPLLGDIDPLNPGQPPASYLSWVSCVLTSKREEV